MIKSRVYSNEGLIKWGRLIASTYGYALERLGHFLSIFAIVTILNAQAEIPARFAGDQIIKHQAYTLSYNEKHEQANWVAYELTAIELDGSFKRTNDFRPDTLVSTGSANLIDYRGSGYDRGHLAPAADMKWSAEVMNESFFMSNISPQEPSFNRGIWKRLEGTVRNWALENEAVFVVTGGILTDGLTTIGPDSVSVPEYFYKVILDYHEPDIKGIGFILPNHKNQGSLAQFVVNIDCVEVVTGIDFFPMIPDSTEDDLESTFNLEAWGLEK